MKFPAAIGKAFRSKYSPLHVKIDVTGKDRTYPNFISAQKYDPRKDKSDWDGYGKARKFRVDMNRNIYRDNYGRDYWQDYDAAENEVAKREKEIDAAPNKNIS